MALPHHRTRRGPGGLLIALAVIVLIALAAAGLWYSGLLKGAPFSATLAPKPTAAAGPQKFSTKCKFTEGDRAGQTVDFAPHAPLPVGGDCNDGTASSGVVVE